MTEPVPDHAPATDCAVVGHATWRLAKAKASEAIARGGIIVLVGRPGVGKTTLLLELEQDLVANRTAVVWIDPASGIPSSRLGIALSDQADDFGPATLRALAKRSVASVLVGGDVLPKSLRRSGAKHTVVRMAGLSLADTADYVATTRRLLGRPAANFDPASIVVLHARTLGIPRLLDITADTAVFLTLLEGADRVLPSHVEAAFSSSADLVDYGQDEIESRLDEQDYPDEQISDGSRRARLSARLIGPAIAIASSAATVGVLGALLHWPIDLAGRLEPRDFGPVRLGAIPMNPVADAAGLAAALSTVAEVTHAPGKPPSDDAGRDDGAAFVPPAVEPVATPRSPPAERQTGTTAFAQAGLAPDPADTTQVPIASTTDPAPAPTPAVGSPPTQVTAAGPNQTSSQQGAASSRDDVGKAGSTTGPAPSPLGKSDVNAGFAVGGEANAGPDASAAPSLAEVPLPEPSGTVPASTAANVPHTVEPPVPDEKTTPFSPPGGLTPQDLGDLGSTPLDDAGLLLVVRPGDTLPMLYARVYRGLRRPPYAKIVSINRSAFKVGGTVVFPAPADGWGRR